MASSRPVASRDGLNKFVCSFEKFATLEDLIDTDSESESESENESGSVVRATAPVRSIDFTNSNLQHSLVSLCISKLEGALLNSLAKAKSEDNVEVRDLPHPYYYLLKTSSIMNDFIVKS